MPRPAYNNIDEYIYTRKPSIQLILQELRAFIKKYAPDSTEKLSWQCRRSISTVI